MTKVSFGSFPDIHERPLAARFHEHKNGVHKGVLFAI